MLRFKDEHAMYCVGDDTAQRFDGIRMTRGRAPTHVGISQISRVEINLDGDRPTRLRNESRQGIRGSSQSVAGLGAALVGVAHLLLGPNDLARSPRRSVVEKG